MVQSSLSQTPRQVAEAQGYCYSLLLLIICISCTGWAPLWRGTADARATRWWRQASSCCPGGQVPRLPPQWASSHSGVVDLPATTEPTTPWRTKLGRRGQNYPTATVYSSSRGYSPSLIQPAWTSLISIPDNSKKRKKGVVTKISIGKKIFKLIIFY